MKKILFSILLICSFTSYAAEVKLITEDSPPANYMKDGKLIGPAVEIVQEIQKKVGHTGKIEVLPWSRGYQMAQTENDVALFSTTRTEEREAIFKWVGPLFEEKWVMLSFKNKTPTIKNLEEAKSVERIGVYLGDVRESILKEKGFTNTDAAQDNSINAIKLSTGRINLWFTSLYEYKILIKNAHLDLNDFKINFEVSSDPSYLAFSKGTSDSTVSKWKKAYQTVIDDGTLEKIRNKAKKD